MISRRHFLTAATSLGALSASPRLALATTARAVSLPELVGLSDHALIATATDALSRWETVGRTRRIVTYYTMQVDQPIDGRPPAEATVVLRTLGGRVGDLGQLVHGEARPQMEHPGVVFVGPDVDGVLSITAMAQGHYTLEDDDERVPRLHASPHVAALIDTDARAAVRTLEARSVLEAEGLVLDCLHER